ncbi:oxidoreductase, 2OG-Fe(II) oxygenase family [Aspergillus mulundensis]|uniref:Prolyl 4-hydroxylase alpha subunit domain-containing protein n=1 Tax=Aspergillus mulundensis TaxID=1810919 RepID=A0A3D8SJP9_9EURO|nr:hypothetical protein DSM5745_03158 [Aspergillus mulundensis]RDW86516.1 hypothetical protein DSM5745_03158 [Aspergillus mulundensis]
MPLNISLSSLFYLIPLYLLVINPLLRQILPSDPQHGSYRFDDDEDDVADGDTLLNLNPDVLSLDDGTPVTCPDDDYRVHILSHAPLVIYIENFLSGEEADALVDASIPNYIPSALFSSSVKNDTTPNIDTTRRLSDQALLPRTQTVRCIEARARSFQGWKPNLYIERMWAQRYNVSGHYTHHYDWVGTAKGHGGDRISTFMVYLKAECKGGGTNFPLLRKPRDKKWCAFIECGDDEGQTEKREGVTFKPIKGNAVFWENLRPDGSGWPETWHAAFPVEEGEKVGLNIWSWYQPPKWRRR